MAPYIPAAELGGCPRAADMREALNSGIQWNMLPHDFPPTGTVYHYYNIWRRGRDMATSERRSTRGIASGIGSPPDAQRRDRRQSVGENQRKGADADTMQAGP